MTCIILQYGSGSAEDQSRVVYHPSGSGEHLSRHETEFIKDPFCSPEVPRRRWTRKSHYVAPPSVPTNPESHPIIKSVGER
jgi:hypothetical protein